ncbi:FAD:protein FMN transferase [Streptomyces sp. E5N91]|uniref:FAD:protein FMN transferase n=1 Tax=Streptomyces sp. E5N91 TaxID=1851996 RepID=UPI001EE98022|nr:FAD:protein FMN transferase [Streptomyces sp. E5N91]
MRAKETPGLRRALDATESLLHHVDEVFSPFRPDSAVNRVRHGRPVPEEWQPELSEVLALCTDAHRCTGGRFAAWHSGVFDPSGLVKGWAVERAALLLREAGAEHVCLNGGGDVQLYGGPWRVGITHPLRPGSCAAVVESPGGPLGIATSGPGERGCHIVDPHTGAPPTDGLASLTVTGPSPHGGRRACDGGVLQGRRSPRVAGHAARRRRVRGDAGRTDLDDRQRLNEEAAGCRASEP